MIKHYILVNRVPLEVDLQTWAQWMDDSDKRYPEKSVAETRRLVLRPASIRENQRWQNKRL